MWANIGWERRAEGIQIVSYYLFILFYLNRPVLSSGMKRKNERICLITTHNAEGSVLLWDILSPLFGAGFTFQMYTSWSKVDVWLCLSITVNTTRGFWLGKYLPGHLALIIYPFLAQFSKNYKYWLSFDHIKGTVSSAEQLFFVSLTGSLKWLDWTIVHASKNLHDNKY